MKTETFQVHEDFAAGSMIFDALEADGGRMMATVRIIRAGKSKNNRNYPAKAIKEAVDQKMFDGIRMFVNHSKTSVLQRPLTEMVSAIESTSWDEKEQAMNGRVEFFDKNFYDYAQRAAPYMGNSINALVRGVRRNVPGGGVEEDVHGFVQPRSVDWVTFPAAGGEILAFEGEEDMIDWTKITAEEIKANAASVYEAIQAEAKAAAKDPDPDPGEGDKVSLSREDVAAIVTAAITAHDQERAKATELKEEAARQVREAFAKAGLPEKTRARLVASFEGVDKYDEAAVTAKITEAKEELAAVGVGPRIKDMGPSGSGDGAAAPSFSVHESVAEAFGITKKAPAKGDAADGGTK